MYLRRKKMSKWLNKKLFESFSAEKINEEENKQEQGESNYPTWKAAAGDVDKNATYEVRLLPYKNGFYKKIKFHFFKVGDKFRFFMCKKQHNDDEYCPICEVVKKLWTGSEADKTRARELKRKEKFVTNIFIVIS